MHFIESFSTALVSALLLTQTLGQFTQVHRRSNEDRDLSVRAIKPSKFMLKYCSMAVPKKVKRDAEARGLEIRAPAGFKEVVMGSFLGHKAKQGGLYTDKLGTCPAFVVTGTPAPISRELPEGGIAKFVFHMSLGDSASMGRFCTTVKNSGMANLRGTMYTVDTRRSNPENKEPGMQAEADASEVTYHELEVEFESLCGSGRIDRKYHPWGKTGEISVSDAHYVTTTT